MALAEEAVSSRRRPCWLWTVARRPPREPIRQPGASAPRPGGAARRVRTHLPGASGVPRQRTMGSLFGSAERRLQARMARRAILERQNGPSYSVVLDEAALRRPVGGPQVMGRQLEALIDTAQKPHVSIRVVPASAGEHACMDGAFVILSFAAELDPDVVYLEGMGGEIYVEDVGQVRRCNVRFDRLCDQALSEDDSMALIAEIAREYQHSDEPAH